MAVSETEKLGKKIGSLSSQQDELSQNISPNDDVPIDTLVFSDKIIPSATLTTYMRRMSDVYQVGHPVYGEIGAYQIGPYCIVGHPSWAMLGDCLIAGSSDKYERTQLNVYNL